MERLCDVHSRKTKDWRPCPKCVEALTQMILFASREFAS